MGSLQRFQLRFSKRLHSQTNSVHSGRRKYVNARGVDVWGPSPAPYAVVRGRHRHRFLVRADRSVDIQAFLRAWLAKVQVPGKVRLKVDIDPYSFL